MSISEQIGRIKDNISSAYIGLEAKNGVMPQMRNSANLRTAINSIKSIDRPLTYSQINEQAQHFLSDVSYDPADYSSSSIASYANQTTGYDKHKGAGVTVNIAESGTLILLDGYTGRMMRRTVSAGETEIFNLTPGERSVYAVVSNNAVVQCGALYPTGSLRMIHPRFMCNVRDLGGWSCDGGTVRYGKLFRGCAVYNQPADWALLHDLLGIRAELDLRWDSEIEAGMQAYNMSEYGSLIGSDVKLTHIDGAWYNDSSTGILAQESNMKAMLECVFDAVESDSPLYFHCVSGADRTGTLAMILEAMLGMRQSDIDKDYELTSFYSGADTDAHARRRNESEWIGLISAFAGYTGSSLRDRVVNWALTIGIPIERINAFRAAMIDGTPSVLTDSVGTVNITKTLSGASTDNTANTNAKYQPYTAEITPDRGKVITSVQVTMGGQDVTESVFSGDDTVFRHSVSYTLTNCLVAGAVRKSVVSGECFCCSIEPDSGYSVDNDDNPTISITMGGVTVSNCYKNGVITIPKVTGNIVINVTAAASALPYTNQIPISTDSGGNVYEGTGYKNGYRFNSSHAEVAVSDYFITGFIPITNNDIIRFSGFDFVSQSVDGIDQGYCRIETYDSSKGSKDGFTGNVFAASGYSVLQPVIVNNRVKQFTVNNSISAFNGAAYIRISGYGTGANAIITVNEEL